MSDLLYFLRLHQARWRWLLAGMILMLATTAANFGLLALSGWFITATGLAGLVLAAGGVMTLEIYTPGAGIRLFAVGRAAARYGERLVNHEAVFRILADLRAWFFRSLLPLDAGRLAALRDGELLNRITGDVDALDHLFLRVAGPTAVAIIGLLSGVGFLSLWAPDLALWIGLILGITTVLTTLTTAVRGMTPARQLAETGSRLRERTVADLQALAELRIYGATDDRLDDWRAVDQQQVQARLQLGRQAALATFAMSTGSQLALWVAAFVGAGLYVGGSLSGPILAMLLLSVLALAELLAPLPSAWQLLARVRWSARRLRALAEESPRVTEPDHPDTPPQFPRIELTDVSFRHRAGQPWCLQDVDLSLRHEERIAILGPSGTGKSSLLELLLRYRDPNCGSIQLSGIALRRLCRKDIDALFSYLPQRTVLFSGTVADNLRIARPDADDATLWHVLQSVALDGFVDSLPEGLDTWLGQHGLGLSGGQARRLALARTLLKPSPVVLLDEPTEGLDRITEQHVLSGLDRWLVGRTLILIAHDRDRLPPLDRVLRLQQGRFRPA